MIAYFDSSGLVKLLITSESGAELASATVRDAEQIVTMVCWDRDLAKAALAEGLVVLPPAL